MGRILFIVLCVVLVVYIFRGVSAPHTNSVSVVHTPPVVILPNPSLSHGNFNETGTLVFYPNNVGPVPYLVYTDNAGRIGSKALVFPLGSPHDFSSWTGARVSIRGQIVDEHVLVSSLVYEATP